MSSKMADTFLQRYGAWALVTGASDGIGRATAELLASEGLNLILVSRRQSHLDQLASDILAKHSVQIRTMAVDLSNSDGNQKLFAFTKDLEVGLLCAAAGFGTSGEFVQNSLVEERNMVDLNCRSVVEQAHHYAGPMRERRRGGLILFSSLVAFQGVPLSANYAATKAFIQTLAEGLFYELRPFGVDVLASAPGPVSTGFAARAKMNMGQAADPYQVARATLAALGRQITVRPGFLAKLLGWSLLTLNRWGRIRVMKLIMQGMVGSARASRN